MAVTQRFFSGIYSILLHVVKQDMAGGITADGSSSLIRIQRTCLTFLSPSPTSIRSVQAGSRPGGLPSRIIDYILTLFQIHVNIGFFPNLHLLITRSWNLWGSPVARVLHYVSNKFEVSTALRFRVNLKHVTDRWTDRRDATLYRPDTSVL